MRLSKEAARSVLIPVLLLSITATGFGQVAGASQQPQQGQAAQPDRTQVIIDSAEASFRQGEQAYSLGQKEAARQFFSRALDQILLSGVEIQSNPRLSACYQSLVDRIHKYDAPPVEERSETTVPSVIDELADINDKDLATVTPGGIKIFGKYDFEFSVAPPVFQFINFFVSGRGHSTMETGLQRSGRYRQMAEKIFKEEKVPVDLMWLAQAESVWKPNALSRAAAKGIWQFIPSSGSRFGLEQTSWVDDRSHPEKSTRAAARYLRWLHDHFAGDWLLAMAAYNSGEARVDDAIARCGYADFWELHKRNLLPQETRNYVPIILSIIIISKNQNRYGFSVHPDSPLNYDTYDLPSQTDLKVVAELAGVPYESVQDLNPELRRGVTPPDQGYIIKLPKGTKKTFEAAFKDLPEEKRMRRVVIPREEVADSGYRSSYRTQIVSYRAKGGDTLAALSRKYGVSVQELARINHLSSHGSLRKGQAIKVPAKAAAESGSRHRSRYEERKISSSRLEKSSRSRSKVTREKAGRSQSRSSRRHRR